MYNDLRYKLTLMLICRSSGSLDNSHKPFVSNSSPLSMSIDFHTFITTEVCWFWILVDNKWISFNYITTDFFIFSLLHRSLDTAESKLAFNEITSLTLLWEGSTKVRSVPPWNGFLDTCICLWPFHRSTFLRMQPFKIRIPYIFLANVGKFHCLSSHCCLKKK